MGTRMSGYRDVWVPGLRRFVGTEVSKYGDVCVLECMSTGMSE